MQKLDLSFNENLVGTVSLCRQGLYWRIRCSAMLPEKRYYRLQLHNESGILDLGSLLFDGMCYVLDTTVSAKKVGTGKPTFKIKSNEQENACLFIPISINEPFSHVADLLYCLYADERGKTGVIVKYPNQRH